MRIIPQGHEAFKDVCTSNECSDRLKNACYKILLCGHPCGGTCHDKECPPCLFEDCAKETRLKLNGVSGDDYCNICFTEGLINAPCVHLKCGHIFHYHCLEKKIKTGWFGPRIFFNFCLCPLCNTWMEFRTPTNPL